MKIYKCICSIDEYIFENSICKAEILATDSWDELKYPKSHKFKVQIENSNAKDYDLFSAKTKKECQEFIKKMAHHE